MFERFTVSALSALMGARAEARRLGHNWVGSDQILLGLIGQKGMASNVLQSMGVIISEVRTEVEKIIGIGRDLVEEDVPFTPRAKRILEHASQRSAQLHHDYIGTGHILCSLMNQEEGVALQALAALNCDILELRQIIEEQMIIESHSRHLD